MTRQCAAESVYYPRHLLPMSELELLERLFLIGHAAPIEERVELLSWLRSRFATTTILMLTRREGMNMISLALIVSWTRVIRNICSTLFEAVRPSRHGYNGPLDTRLFIRHEN